MHPSILRHGGLRLSETCSVFRHEDNSATMLNLSRWSWIVEHLGSLSTNATSFLTLKTKPVTKRQATGRVLYPLRGYSGHPKNRQCSSRWIYSQILPVILEGSLGKGLLECWHSTLCFSTRHQTTALASITRQPSRMLWTTPSDNPKKLCSC
jgi:hypothetical protein